MNHAGYVQGKNNQYLVNPMSSFRLFYFLYIVFNWFLMMQYFSKTDWLFGAYIEKFVMFLYN